MTSSPTISLRIQKLSFGTQTLVLGRILSDRSESNSFTARSVMSLMESLGLPEPGNIHAVLDRLKKNGRVRHTGTSGEWRLTPTGMEASLTYVSPVETAALSAFETSIPGGSILGKIHHGVIGPEIAPLAILSPLLPFLQDHPFESNVFGMTRFPDEQDPATLDPVRPALDAARDVCAKHGLEFHLASDRAISDDLWTNVAAHMWASKYGIAFFEDRQGRGVNYNLTIEVGAMLMTGRRCALLRDRTIKSMPTDLVGLIYKPVDLDIVNHVVGTLENWIVNDLAL